MFTKSMFTDRDDAGSRLGRQLATRTDVSGPGTVVLGLPRGGVPVAARVAEALGAPLDIMGVAKLRHPAQPELAIGALGEGGVRVVDDDSPRTSEISAETRAAIERSEAERLVRQVSRLRCGRARVALHDRTAVIVDDGIATGSSARAACAAARSAGATRVIMAVPTGPRGVAVRLPEADELVVLCCPRPFGTVSRHYLDFSEVDEDVVLAELAAAADRTGRSAS